MRREPAATALVDELGRLVDERTDLVTDLGECPVGERYPAAARGERGAERVHLHCERAGAKIELGIEPAGGDPDVHVDGDRRPDFDPCQ